MCKRECRRTLLQMTQSERTFNRETCPMNDVNAPSLFLWFVTGLTISTNYIII